MRAVRCCEGVRPCSRASGRGTYVPMDGRRWRSRAGRNRRPWKGTSRKRPCRTVGSQRVTQRRFPGFPKPGSLEAPTSVLTTGNSRGFPGFPKPGSIEASTAARGQLRPLGFRAFQSPAPLKQMISEPSRSSIVFPGLRKPGSIEATPAALNLYVKRLFPGFPKPGSIEAVRRTLDLTYVLWFPGFPKPGSIEAGSGATIRRRAQNWFPGFPKPGSIEAVRKAPIAAAESCVSGLSKARLH